MKKSEWGLCGLSRATLLLPGALQGQLYSDTMQILHSPLVLKTHPKNMISAWGSGGRGGGSQEDLFGTVSPSENTAGFSLHGSRLAM